MRLYLDDIRNAPPNWTVAKTQEEAISYLETGRVQEISFDHDLGDGNGSGYGVACHIEKMAARGEIAPIGWRIHSANPIGRSNIEAAMWSAERIWEQLGM